ncbi:hypothetical protein [Chondrinema litorale]|uniref:hypothetical protein n=1 Tax=Chondrinema litorale TaxID=2994555 RepID=UPI002542DDAF|nr:hypothetical protein [Chondrinema litorale]UZR96561.1 hypothetical protein OQ292_20655 [Chondrinema litorale]
MKSRINLIYGLLAIVLFTASCNDDDDMENQMEPDTSLYATLGGTTMVDDPNNPGTQIEQGRLNLRAVVDSSIFVIAADSRLTPYFQVLLSEVGSNDLTGFAALSESLTDFFAVATGSENTSYTGLNMMDAHDPAKNDRMAFAADDAAMDAFIEDVVKGAELNGVTDPTIITPIGDLLESLRSSVVQRTETLYDRLGGTAMVEDPANSDEMIEQGRLTLRGVVDSTIFVIASDTRLQPYFEVLLAEVGEGDLTGFAALSSNLTDFFSVAAGSTTQSYNGLNMADAHDPTVNNRMAQAADDDAMDAFIEDAVVGLSQNGVTIENNRALVNEIGALVNSLRGVIVQAD